LFEKYSHIYPPPTKCLVLHKLASKTTQNLGLVENRIVEKKKKKNCKMKCAGALGGNKRATVDDLRLHPTSRALIE